MTEGPPGIHLRRPVRVESLNSQVDSLALAFALRPRQPVQPCPQAPGLGPEGPEGPYQSPSVPCRHTYSHTAQQQILPLHTWSEGLAGGSHWGRGALPERLEDSSLRGTSPPLLSAQRAQTLGADTVYTQSPTPHLPPVPDPDTFLHQTRLPSPDLNGKVAFRISISTTTVTVLPALGPLHCFLLLRSSRHVYALYLSLPCPPLTLDLSYPTSHHVTTRGGIQHLDVLDGLCRDGIFLYPIRPVSQMRYISPSPNQFQISS